MFSVIQSPQYKSSCLRPVSSSLASRHVNVCPQLSFLMASTFEDPKKVRHKARVNRHPVVQRRVEEPERRRHWFLKRVKDAGDHKRWQTRSDQVHRREHVLNSYLGVHCHRSYATTSCRSKSSGETS